jgi:transcriptional regulator with XRE-family HTH domain
METVEEIVRKRLRSICKKDHGLQKKLAPIAQVSEQHFSKILSGEYELTKDKIRRLSDFLKLDLYGDALRSQFEEKKADPKETKNPKLELIGRILALDDDRAEWLIDVLDRGPKDSKSRPGSRDSG